MHTSPRTIMEPRSWTSEGGTPIGLVTRWRTAAPRSPGVRNGWPRQISNKRNQTATTAAPIKPATIPSLRIDRCTGGIVSERSAPCIACREAGSGVLGVAGESDAVVGVTQVRRQGRAMGDRAPRVGVTPGAAAAHAPRAGRRAARIPGGRAAVIVLAEPVGAPFVADAGEVGEPERVARRLADPRRTIELDGGLRVAPRVAGIVETAARGLFPLGLRRQPGPRPRRERRGLGPREADEDRKSTRL